MKALSDKCFYNIIAKELLTILSFQLSNGNSNNNDNNAEKKLIQSIQLMICKIIS